MSTVAGRARTYLDETVAGGFNAPVTPIPGATALVTGGSSGIGKAIVRALRSRGFHARSLDRRDVGVDVTDEAARTRWFTENPEPIDLFVNNAGAMLLGAAATSPLDEWERMVELNLTAAMRWTHAVLPGMLERGQGDLVFVGSVLGLSTAPLASVYCATKFGLAAFADSIRKETVGTGVRVITVNPGRVETELRTHIRPEVLPELEQAGYAKVEGISTQRVADAVMFAINMPRSVSVSEITIRPTGAAM